MKHLLLAALLCMTFTSCESLSDADKKVIAQTSINLAEELALTGAELGLAKARAKLVEEAAKPKPDADKLAALELAVTKAEKFLEELREKQRQRLLDRASGKGVTVVFEPTPTSRLAASVALVFGSFARGLIPAI